MVGGKGTKVNQLALEGMRSVLALAHMRQQLQRIVAVSQLGRLENERVLGSER